MAYNLLAPHLGRHLEALYGFSAEQVLVNDLVHVARVHAAVHHPLGVDEHDRAQVAGAETAGAGKYDLAEECAFVEFATELHENVLAAVGRA